MKNFICASAIVLVALGSRCFAGYEFKIVPTGAPIQVGDSMGNFKVLANWDGTAVSNLLTYQFSIRLAGKNGIGSVALDDLASSPAFTAGTQADGTLSTIGSLTAIGAGTASVLLNLNSGNPSLEIANFKYTLGSGQQFQQGDYFEIAVTPYGAGTPNSPDSFLGNIQSQAVVGNSPSSVKFGPAAVPEPSSAILLAIGGLGACLRRRRS